MERITTQTSTKKTHEERLKICQKCPNYSKFWKTCKICHCFMPLKTKLRWAECPDEPPRWTQEREMPKGKGTYGSKRGRPKKKGGKKKKSMGGLTAAQKKLPKKLQQAILKRKRKK